MQMITLKDGRQLALSVSGPEDGTPLIFQHMTPGAGVAPGAIERAAHARGLRVVSFARPGYRGSTRLPGRSVADAARDTEEVLDQLGISRCLIGGLSGGGPHALAAAAILPERVAAVLSIAGFAPCDQPDLDFLAGRGEGVRLEFELARQGEAALSPYLDALASSNGEAPPEALVAAVGSLLSAVDEAAAHGDFAPDLVVAFQEGLTSSVRGWLDDDLAINRPWGFAPQDITVPVFLWQGDQDLLVPEAHGRWLAKHIPGARLRFEVGEGHFSILAHAGRMIDDLVDVLKG
jgi:pimeloyl-ACP methyl ester carboxylesterase